MKIIPEEGVRWHNGELQPLQLAPPIAAESIVEDKNAAWADRQRAEAFEHLPDDFSGVNILRA